MRFVFKLPDVGEGTAEAEIVAWHVAVGERVTEDQHLVDVMTDKATVEITAPVAGTVLALHGNAGDMAAVGASLAEFEADVAATPDPPQDAAPAKALAAPAVRHRAAEHGIALAEVVGSGPEGRVTQSDLDEAISGRNAPSPAHQDGAEIKLTGLRRRIAERMAEAKRRIPHFAYVEEIDMTELEALRTHLNGARRSGQPKLTVLPFLMRALVRSVADFPQINAHFDDEAGVVRRFAAVHIGIATQTDAGLMVPVVKNAERLDIWAAATEVVRLAERARAGKAERAELTGSTITISSLGALGGIVTTPIINLPEVAIIAPNAIVERPVVRDGTIVVRKMMNLSSCYDHRVVDGADAAAFVQRLKTQLEHPALLFLDA